MMFSVKKREDSVEEKPLLGKAAERLSL